MADQRYVSGELSHFVGRALLGDLEGQYQLLLTILRSGELKASRIGAAVLFAAPLFPEEAGRYTQGPICFCDIPEPDLGIHVQKYGPFGLAFTKEFSVAHGARPVFYVAETAVWGAGGYPVRDRLNKLVASLGNVQSQMHTRDHPLNDESQSWREDLQEALMLLLDQELLPFVKGFDPLRPDEDPKNYYMEREWRTTHHYIQFSLDEVRRVFLPERFAKRFRDDLPAYANQVTFVPVR